MYSISVTCCRGFTTDRTQLFFSTDCTSSTQLTPSSRVTSRCGTLSLCLYKRTEVLRSKFLTMANIIIALKCDTIQSCRQESVSWKNLQLWLSGFSRIYIEAKSVFTCVHTSKFADPKHMSQDSWI